MPSLAEDIALLPEAERQEFYEGLSEKEVQVLPYMWEFWARPNQLPPGGDWMNWLLLAGRGFGKTRTGVEWVINQARDNPNDRIAIVAPTAADCRDTIVEGESGIIACSSPDFFPLYEPSKRRLTWPNGAQATLFSAEEPERLRGPQHSKALCDEMCAWKYAQETWDMLMFGMRLGNNPQIVIATTPKPIPLLIDIAKRPETTITGGSSYENKANLSKQFIDTTLARYEGTRLGRQELHAEILSDVPGALWTRDLLDRQTLPATTPRPNFVRIVVGVDPSGVRSSEDSANQVGIVVVGKDSDGNGYVLEDATLSDTPAKWGNKVVEVAKSWMADRIVAEENFGGAMVEFVLRSVDANIPYKPVKASRGKSQRAEPIAALYEQGKIFHLGGMPDLDDQYCFFTDDGYIGGGSPDRGDAAIWALTEIMLRKRQEVFSFNPAAMGQFKRTSAWRT